MFTVDRLKLIVAVLILAGGIGLYYYLGDKPTFIRILALLACAAAALAIALFTAMGRNAWEFTKGARIELRKVVWPTRKETTQMTLVVVVMVIVAGLFLWMIDWFLTTGIRFLTGQGS